MKGGRKGGREGGRAGVPSPPLLFKDEAVPDAEAREMAEEEPPVVERREEVEEPRT